MVRQLLQAALLGAMALGESPCQSEVASLSPVELALPYTLASGKSLPYDAGRYVMCRSHENTRYFLAKMTGTVPGYPPIPMQVGFCVPEVCDHDGIVDLISSPTVRQFIPLLFLTNFNMSTVSNITATSPDLDLKPVDTGCLIASAIFLTIVVIICGSTLVVLASQPARPSSQEPREAPPPSRSSSLGGQGQQLLHVEDGSQPREPRRNRGWKHNLASFTVVKAFTLFGSTGTLNKLVEKAPYKPTDCLNGLRVLSMAWIIMGHTFLMPTGISGYMNYEDVVDNPLNENVAERNPLFQIVLGAQNGVDTFFYLSGFLLAHLTLKEIRAGRMKIIPAIILRYLRLTPSLALVMMVYYKIWVFFAAGPFSVQFQDSINSRCGGSWWSELTYTMNFIPFDSDKVCMGWTWYLGDDMIFFIISMFLLPVYYRSKWTGWTIVALLSGLSFGVTAWLVVKYNLGIYVFDDHYQRYSYYAYSKPYTRIPAYFVGIVGAWLLDELEQRGITRETRSTTPFAKAMATIAAVVSAGVLLFVIFIPATNFGNDANSWSTFVNVLFIDFSRPLWTMAWAVLTILCYYGYLPVLDGFLAHSYWTPFARLTYGAYLVHPLVIKLAAGRALQFYTFDTLGLAYRLVGNCTAAYCGSVLLWVLVERPCMTIFSPAKKKPTGAKALKSPPMSRTNSGPESMQESTIVSTRSNSVRSLTSMSAGSDQNSSLENSFPNDELKTEGTPASD